MKTKTAIQKTFVFALALIAIKANSQNTFPATGSVGVGTTTPAKQLNVHQVAGSNKGILISGDEYYQTGNGDANGILLLSGVNRAGNRQLWIGDNTALGSTTLGLFRYQTGTALPTIDAVTGNGLTRLPLGIGTNTSNVAVGFEYTGATGTTLPASRLSVNGNATVGNGYIGTVAPSNGLLIQGNLGIGTPTPGSQMHIYSNSVGSMAVEGALSKIDWKAGYNIDCQIGRGSTSYFANILYANSTTFGSSKQWALGLRPDNSDYHIYSDGGGFEAFTIQQTTGNIGISTASPTEKLSVNGNIRAKKIIVTQTGWADYVFHPTYKLPPLSSLEIYINKNKHLPDVPSAEEVEKEGLDIGSTQAVLLRKIEELTLYIIEHDKKNNKLEELNGLLQQRVERLEKIVTHN